MAKHKPPKDIRNRRQAKLPQTPTPNNQWWKPPAKVLTAIMALLGAIAAIVSFLPKLSLDVSGSLRPHDPMGTVFYLSNDGVLPLYDVDVGCGIEDFHSRNVMVSGIAMYSPNSWGFRGR
jgi:hypothetical protein